MSDSELLSKLLGLVMHSYSLLLLVLENQSILMEHAGIAQEQDLLRALERARQKNFEEIAGRVFGQDAKLEAMLEHLGVRSVPMRGPGGPSGLPDHEAGA